ncbi:MAG TPA: type II secretion system major pseudopilin GspG [Candidatus Didemnitutus sp.]|nr:type II secretion system major pseudopilin GspG [Candidatus Didemnitutus sp.]
MDNLRRRAQRAFTLVEMLVVLAILGMLIGLLVTNSEKIFGNSQAAVAKIFVHDSLKTALTRYRMDIGDYPSTEEGIEALMVAPGGKADRWHGPYLDAPGNKVPLDPWAESYQYRYPGTKNAGSYDLFSKGPDKAADTADDIGNW